MIAFILTSIIAFLVTTLFGQIVHWTLHQRWSGSLNKSHMTHHLALYPVSSYRSETYRDPGKDSTVKIFALAALPLLAAPILLCCLGKISVFLTLWALAEMLTLGWLHDSIHDSFHLYKTFWSKLPWYKGWAKLHYLHHVDMQKNFGIFTFFWDRVFGTLKPKLY